MGMDKWPEERIEAYKRYVANEDKNIELFERQLEYKQKEIQCLQRAIKRASQRRESDALELRNRGWELTEQGWNNTK
ncbi:hypothetical protein B4918_07640 [Bacillus thuringiensis]|uniref:Uncharacterized protein n=2 Tax=Bacillus thuringiensis TaxID=1428 RepID=A0A9W3XHR2_BACTU|nr:hypothetical protein B4918_07640 [Bacillus thuringiensis]MDR4151255.1 hypothetical protein [Bacillus thuringiensis]